MRKDLNCPNCGSAITAEKCPYCGAVFYDFTAIKVNDPCYVKIRWGDSILKAEVIVSDMRISIEPNYLGIMDIDGGYHRICERENTTIDMTMRVLNRLSFDKGDEDDETD